MARLTTLLLGWWGIPWGPFYSLNALFTPSDGVMDAKFNAGYLRWLSGYLLQLGDRHEAKKAVQASLRLRYDAEFAAAAQAVFGAEVSAEHIYQQEHRRRIVWYVIATVVILAAIILAAFFGSWVMGQKPLGGFGGFGPTATMPSTPSTMPSAAGATATGATMTMAARVASPTAAADAADLSWSHFASANGEVALDYPSDWVVEKETSGEVQLIGLRNGVTLFWRPAVHESYPDGYINHLIAQSEGNANSAQNYGDRLRDYLNDVFGQANIAAVADLKIKQIGPYHTIFNSVITQGGDGEGAGRALHLLLYFFDCGANTCQLTAYVDGNKPLSMADFGVIERVIRSIQMDPAAHNSSDSSD